MLHTNTDDGRTLTPPKELKPLLKDSFPAFEKLLGHIRFFYMADEEWDGTSRLAFRANGEQLFSVSLAKASFAVHTAHQDFHVVDESLLDTMYAVFIEAIPAPYHRPAEQLAMNPNGPFCGFRCDMCLTNMAYLQNDTTFSEKFDYVNWLCYRHCLDVDMDTERYKYTKATCSGCNESKRGNCGSKYLLCATEKGFTSCADCGGYHTCEIHKNSHYPGQCNLGLTAEEVTALVIPYAMKERLDFSRNFTE